MQNLYILGSANRSRDFVRSYSKSEYEFNVFISK